MLNTIKAHHYLNTIFKFVPNTKRLKIINYNKRIQNILSITIDDYIKCFNQIEIEIIPKETLEEENTKNIFINISEKDLPYYHIYIYHSSKQELNRNYLKKEEIGAKIKIEIDKEIKSLSGLFKNCYCIKEIKFIRFNRLNITDISYMFNNCISLTKLDIAKIKTDNVINMLAMFYNCPMVSELDISNFKTENVIDMAYMFGWCSNLRKLNISQFNTNQVNNISGMFCKCNSLLELDLNNFITEKVTNMSCLFQLCSNLKN